ncbi:HEPN domain-containing protein [Methylobacterium oryzisoli]|uniref:HEPN domain-containing protein n=1 Tax=Methylobacterium oryzisoli TaxID=3385502 RepID=UPI003891B7E6
MTELWLRAEEALAEARILLAAGRPNGAISRAYYAAFTAVRVIVTRRTGARPEQLRRHAAALKMFSEHFISTGLIDREFGRGLRHLFSDRASADYDGPRLTPDDAGKAVAFAERFIAAAAPFATQPPEPEFSENATSD